jgi:hypothetical protein
MSKMKTKPRIVKTGPWVYVEGEGAVCINSKGVRAKKLLRDHINDQKAYIKRLQDRVSRIEAAL